MSAKVFTHALKVTLSGAAVGTGVALGWVYGKSENLPLEHRGSYLRRVLEVGNAFFLTRAQEFRRGDIATSQWEHARLVASLAAAPSNKASRIRKSASALEKAPEYSSIGEALKEVPKTNSTSLPVLVNDVYVVSLPDDRLLYREALKIAGYHHDVLWSEIREKIINGRYMQCLSPSRTHYILIGSDCATIS